MITINQLGMQYNGKLLFSDVNLNLNGNCRYGLIGANGAGKSTFFKLITGEEAPSIGEIAIQKGKVIGWLKQDLTSFQDEKIVTAVIAGKRKLYDSMKEKEELLLKKDFSDEDGFKLAHLEEIIFDLEGYMAESRAEEILVGLGIDAVKHQDKVSSLSGGYQLRVLLAQCIFADPDILLLDEPTNHLDIFSIKWLEDFLIKDFRGTLIFISHDSDFLNNLSTHILDIDYGEVTPYKGNFDKFRIEKEARQQLLEHHRDALERKIAKARVFIERFRAKASRAAQSASREKLIDKIEVPDLKVTTRIPPNFVFTKEKPSGKKVLELTNISKKFGDLQVLNNVSFNIQRGEKVAIVGKNGMGKSTSLKIIVDSLKADTGSVEFGHEVSYAYFSQDHHDQLHGNLSVVNWLEQQLPENMYNIRKSLGQMLFKNEETNKNIQDLSGGEAARLLFSYIMLKNANLLILDEPTNHMDLETIEALGNALNKFDGTVLLVSHNRHFITQVATRIITVDSKGIKSFNGNYADYEKAFINI
jgi:ATPase subunit of ABC transporter with duplicated ATPase domains